MGEYRPTAGVRDCLRGVRAWQIWTLPRSARAYILGIISFAFAATGFAAARTHWRLADLAAFAGLLACGAIAIESSRTVREVQDAVVRDLQTIWYLAIAITLPPVYALLAPLPLTAYRLWRVRRGFVYRRVFLFHSVPGSAGGARPGPAWHALIWAGVVAGCAVAGWVINNCLLLGAISLAEPQVRMGEMFANREAITTDLIELNLAVSASLVVAISPFLIPLVLTPVVIARRSVMKSRHVTQLRVEAGTGLLAAGTWHREARVALLRALRERAPLALAVAEIDHWRDVGDMAGQPVRDQLIRSIAGMLRDQLPGHELIGRLGVQEFAILLPETARDEAQRISERLRDHIAGEPVAIEARGREEFVFRLTVSIGVAILNESMSALADLIGAAHSALGHARSTGWSKVYVLPGSSGEPGRLADVRSGSTPPGATSPPQA
jgi:diguanylate cyclase (GGDEF)-like protein